MKNILMLSLSMLVLVSGGAFAGGAPLTASTGSASFISGERTYLGSYAMTDRSISVDIDGLNYKGNYTSLAEDSAGPSSGATSGSWGRAFLFASSARTLRCQLDAGFPKVSGQCQDAGGRLYLLKPDSARKTVALP